MASNDAKTSQQIFRKDNPIILACNRHQAMLLPIRLAYNASGYKTGRVLARNSTSGFYQNYDDLAASGLNTAKAILFEDVPVEQFADSSDTQLARGIFGGKVFEDKLLGLDANGKVDLLSRSIVDATGAQILTF